MKTKMLKFISILLIIFFIFCGEEEVEKEQNRKDELISQLLFFSFFYDFRFPYYIDFPITFIYSTDTKIAYTGEFFLINKPFVFSLYNNSFTFSSSASLPSGITLNQSTGEISGTPSNTQDEKEYTITLLENNTKKTSTAKIKIRIGNTTAIRVYGQGSFTSANANNGGITSTSLNSPNTIAANKTNLTSTEYSYTTSSQKEYLVTDTTNNRVLYYSSDSTTATKVYGQASSYTSALANNGGVTSTSLNSPSGVFSYLSRVYISDTGNHRVLYYASSSVTAEKVFGQAGSLSSAIANNGGISSTSLNSPTCLFLNSRKLYICDSGNHRVLAFDASSSSVSTTADTVYGQSSSFSTGTANNGGISSNSLNNPTGIAVDSNNGVYIVDKGNHRVLYYSSGSTTASRVYGQGGVYTSNTANNGGISASSLNSPSAVLVSNYGTGIYIVDSGNNRVLYFTDSSTTASKVYGQSGSFTTNTANNGGLSASSLNNPTSISQDESGRIFIVDSGNHRVLSF